MFQPTIENDKINELPVAQYPGEIIVVDTYDKCLSALKKISQFDLLGFDTETRPSFKKGRMNKVALLQLATSETAWLFRLTKIGFPASLLRILEDVHIKKVGVAIHEDLNRLKIQKEFLPANFIDLAKYVKEFNILDNGLRKLAANILKLKISKAQQLSNWESVKLIPQQLNYAATDAWVCYEIYNQLLNLRYDLS